MKHRNTAALSTAAAAGGRRERKGGRTRSEEEAEVKGFLYNVISKTSFVMFLNLNIGIKFLNVFAETSSWHLKLVLTIQETITCTYLPHLIRYFYIF